MRRLSPAAVVQGVEPEGEDFFPGDLSIGVIVGYGERSYGFGLFFSYVGGDEPGFMFVLGPLGLYYRRYIGWDFRLLPWRLAGG